MKFIIKKSTIGGEVTIPASKSHSIRAAFFAALADGKSTIKGFLSSKDADSSLNTIQLFGAKINKGKDELVIKGFGNTPTIPQDIIDVGNSGTTIRIALSVATLVDGYTVFTGDSQIKTRPMGQLLAALKQLGAQTISTQENGRVPIIIKGKAEGGKTSIDSVTSQFLTSLLITCPLLEKDTTIKVIRLNERPYIDITLWWLNRFNIKYKNFNYEKFIIQGKQKYSSFYMTIPGDFSSATFFIILAAISNSSITLNNLDMSDPQGDKAVVSIIEKMGADIIIDKVNNKITVKGNQLKGLSIDMNTIPDALPAMAVAACFAEGETKLYNVPQARLKETDRIKVMAQELTKMGADIKELDDGLLIKHSKLHSANLDGHLDHRVIMALSIGALMCEGETTIENAEAVDITFPEFPDLIIKCGGNIIIK